jgi:CheY-like chemotaxis protein
VIADTGPGIPESLQKKIFDPLFTTKSTGKGTGLSLWISYNIIEKMAGKPGDAEQGRPRRHLYHHAFDRGAHAELTILSTISGGRMQQPSILVVDDEGDFLETLIKRLEKKKIAALGCASGEEALLLVRENPFDVVVLDIKMPGGMNGIQTLQEIKKARPETEVILVTGHASLETSREGMQHGAYDYLLKPIRLEDLLEKLAQALERKGGSEHRAQSEEIRKLL